MIKKGKKAKVEKGLEGRKRQFGKLFTLAWHTKHPCSVQYLIMT